MDRADDLLFYSNLLKYIAWGFSAGIVLIPFVSKRLYDKRSKWWKVIKVPGYLMILFTLTALVCSDQSTGFAENAKDIRLIAQRLESTQQLNRSKDSIIEVLAKQYRLYYDSSKNAFDLNAKKTTSDLRSLKLQSKPLPNINFYISRQKADSLTITTRNTGSPATNVNTLLTIVLSGSKGYKAENPNYRVYIGKLVIGFPSNIGLFFDKSGGHTELYLYSKTFFINEFGDKKTTYQMLRFDLINNAWRYPTPEEKKDVLNFLRKKIIIPDDELVNK